MSSPFEQILNELHRKHYCSDNANSDVTSSHWRKYGRLTRVRKQGKGFLLSGSGFGNFVPAGSLRSIKFLLPSLRFRKSLNKYAVYRKNLDAGLQVARLSRRVLDFDCMKQILSVDVLHKQGVLAKVRSIAVIGDGYGYMTSLLRTLLPEVTVLAVNLRQMLFFDVYYAAKNFPDADCALNSFCPDGPRLIFWEAENFQELRALPIDLFINIASMQEMDLKTVVDYFSLMRSARGARFFYCCNRIEKTLPDGSIIRFNDYPWSAADEVFFDELCPWYQRFPVNLPPFWKNFDGPIQHRLVKLGDYV